MHIKLKELETQDYYNLVISLEIISQEIANVSQKLVVNGTKMKLFANRKMFQTYLSLTEEKETLTIELNRLNEYLTQIISLIN